MIIDQLPEVSSVQETDEIPVERGTTTYKATLRKLKDLIDNVTDLDITATAASGVAIRSVNFHKIGRIAFGAIYFDVTSAISSGEDIATLNRDLPQPIGAYTVASVCNSVGTPGMVYLTRGVSNKIKAWSKLSVGNYYYAQFIYVII